MAKTKITAAVVREKSQSFLLEELELDEPRANPVQRSFGDLRGGINILCQALKPYPPLLKHGHGRYKMRQGSAQAV